MDINKAIKTLNSLKQYNFSQGVVVRNKKVISIEIQNSRVSLIQYDKNRDGKLLFINK